MTITNTDHLSDSWVETKILDESNGIEIEFADPSTKDGEYGIVEIDLTTLNGVV